MDSSQNTLSSTQTAISEPQRSSVGSVSTTAMSKECIITKNNWDTNLAPLAPCSSTTQDSDTTETTTKTTATTNNAVRDAIRKYPGALWALGPSTGLVMEGMDTALTGGFLSFPSFTRKFGGWVEQLGKYEIPALWETGLFVACQGGQIAGLIAAGTVVDRVGYRKTLIAALLAQVAAIAIMRESMNLKMYLGGEVLLGVTLGAFESLSTSYANDVAPAALRPYLVTYNNMCWVMGQLMAQGVLRGFVNSSMPESYKTVLSLQWAWPPLLVLAVFLMPESPIWLAVKAKDEAGARRSLGKIASRRSPGAAAQIDADYDAILATDRQEKQGRGDKTTWAQCFRGPDLRRTLVSCLVWTGQNLSGAAFIGFAPKFFEKAGMTGGAIYTCSILFCAAGILGTVVSWFAMRSFGRRTMLLTGMALCMANMAGMGLAGLVGSFSANSQLVGIVVAALFAFFVACYDVTLGPVTYVSVGEIPSTRQRAKTVTLARLCYNLTGIANFFVVPQMLNSDSWNWGPKSAFVFAATSLVFLVLTYLFVPETRGLKPADLDNLFREGVPARKFAKSANGASLSPV